MRERLVSESLRPVLGVAGDHDAAVGEPVLPGRFLWGEREIQVAEVLEVWKELSPGSRAMPDRYVRKHWYRIRTADGLEAKLYFERKSRSAGQAKRRWWLFSVVDAGEPAG